MLIFIHGTDTFRTHERAVVLREGFKKKYDTTGANVQVLDATSAKVADIRSNLLMRGLFTSRRFLILKNIFSLSSDVSDVFIDATKKIDEEAIVVCTMDSLPKQDSELKAVLLAADLVEEYNELSDREIMNWVKQRVTLGKCTITTDALAYIVQAVGNDLWTLHQAVEQLTHYTTHITLENVSLFVSSPINDNIFHFTDAISEKNTARALELLHDQISAGANEFYLLSMIARQLSILIEIKETDGKGSSLHPYVIKKSRKHAQRFNLDQLVDLHEQILNIDYLLKSSKQSSSLLLDKFVVEATQEVT
ncbi:MAG: DNA polymerase III subunit delta [bacterium]|nr:DNA polymerase III subunit delta [bacterium]